jgi:putative transposase
MNITHVIKLNPTPKQVVFFRQSCGVARFAYNWALNKWQEEYKAGQKPSAYSLIKELTAIKRQEFTWMLDVGKCAPQYAIHHLESAYKKMWKEGRKYPKFKKKGVKDRFVAVEKNNDFKQENKKIWIPRLGWVKCYEDLRFNGKVNNVVIKRIADMWFACINMEVPDQQPIVSESQATVGIDLGIKTMMVLSDGTTYANPKALRTNSKALKRLQRGLARKVKGSANRKKHQIRLARKHYKIACIRKTVIHQATTQIVRNYDRIVIEDLNVAGMKKNHKLAQAVGDVSFSEIRRQINYKAQWAGKEVVVADRFFPSSKRCSCCGNVKEKLSLSVRTYKCDVCGSVIDRDLNAARNLEDYGTYKLDESASNGKACGVGSSAAYQQSPSVKQEVELNNVLTI